MRNPVAQGPGVEIPRPRGSGADVPQSSNPGHRPGYHPDSRAGGWRIDEDGMLRVTAHVLKEGVFPYAAAEMPHDRAALPGVDPLRIYIPATEFSPEALRSLEGKPVVVRDHVWRTAANTLEDEFTVGTVAGRPFVTPDGRLVCDCVIYDPEAIEAVKRGELVEVSAGYAGEFVPERGAFNGEAYHGRQTHLRFNHVLLLPQGRGRCGADVRITNSRAGTTGQNQQGADNMPETTRRALKNPGENPGTAPGRNEPDQHGPERNNADRNGPDQRNTSRTKAGPAGDGSSPAAPDESAPEEFAQDKAAPEETAVAEAVAEAARVHEILGAAAERLKAALDKAIAALENAPVPERGADENPAGQEDDEAAIIEAENADSHDAEREKRVFNNAKRRLSPADRRAALVARVFDGRGLSSDAMTPDATDAVFAFLAADARTKLAARETAVPRVPNGAKTKARAPGATNHSRILAAVETMNTRGSTPGPRQGHRP